ncbi:hypothetical protein [Aurantiacibacter gilvus]|uniref:DUF2946 domain-containing protein n=1 Tax=Aurantiacibacter gilvus TaxID=3139141 RepID=A0ABU9IDN2_9SPHN
MTGLRKLITLKGPKSLVLLLAALALHALVPTGHMLAATPGHGLAVTMCPVTHPLARAALEDEGDQAHTAMHGVDHAAMGHAPLDLDDGVPVTAQGKQDCAFSALGSAALGVDAPAIAAPVSDGATTETPELPDLAIRPADRLRPPLRAPPRQG